MSRIHRDRIENFPVPVIPHRSTHGINSLSSTEAMRLRPLHRPKTLSNRHSRRLQSLLLKMITEITTISSQITISMKMLVLIKRRRSANQRGFCCCCCCCSAVVGGGNINNMVCFVGICLLGKKEKCVRSRTGKNVGLAVPIPIPKVKSPNSLRLGLFAKKLVILVAILGMI